MSSHNPGDPDDVRAGDMSMTIGPDAVLEDVLAGNVPAGHGELGELVALLDALRRPEPAPAINETLRAALVAGPVVSLDRHRRRRVLGAVAAGAVVLVSATGVAAANNVLPGPIQDAVASVTDAVGLDAVGLDAPHAGDRGHAGEDPRPDRGNDTKGHDPQGPKEEGDSPSVTAPGQTDESPSDTAPGQTGEDPRETPDPTTPTSNDNSGGNGGGNPTSTTNPNAGGGDNRPEG